MTRARALSHRTAKGKHYGEITAKALDVLEALLWTFHNAKTGLCFPSLEKIAEAAGCARSTVAEAIKALEAAGLLSWVNRLKRVRESVQGLLGEAAGRIRVMRTSNGYRLHDPRPAPKPDITPKCSKSENPTGTTTQDIFSSIMEPQRPPSPLEASLARLGEAVT